MIDTNLEISTGHWLDAGFQFGLTHHRLPKDRWYANAYLNTLA